MNSFIISVIYKFRRRGAVEFVYIKSFLYGFFLHISCLILLYIVASLMLKKICYFYYNILTSILVNNNYSILFLRFL